MYANNLPTRTVTVTMTVTAMAMAIAIAIAIVSVLHASKRAKTAGSFTGELNTHCKSSMDNTPMINQYANRPQANDEPTCQTEATKNEPLPVDKGDYPYLCMHIFMHNIHVYS